MSDHADIDNHFECALWIAGYMRTRGYAPSIDEMAAAWGVVKSQAHRRLRKMISLGLAAKIPHKNRSVHAIVPDQDGKRTAYFKLVPILTNYQVRTTELRFLYDRPQ
jgi:SOS-response transcriptional repressor LexA